MVFGQLQVVLYATGLIPGGDAAVDPGRLVEFLPRVRRLFQRQYGGDVHQHVVLGIRRSASAGGVGRRDSAPKMRLSLNFTLTA